MSDMRPPITAGPIARAFKFLKSTSVNCGVVAEGDGVAADDKAGVVLAAARSFPDHHRYTRAEAVALCDDAQRAGLVLMTTEKDLARLSGEDQLKELAARAKALPVTLAFEEDEAMKSLLLERLAQARTGGDR